MVSLPEIFIWQRIFYDVVQLGFCGTVAKVSYENWATQASIERVSALASRPLFLSWIVGVSVCSPPCPWYMPHSVGPSLFPELRDVLPMCLQRPYHPAKVLHLVHPSSSPQSSLVLIIKATHLHMGTLLNLPPCPLRHSSMMTARNHTCVPSRSYQPIRLPFTTTSSSDCIHPSKPDSGSNMEMEQLPVFLAAWLTHPSTVSGRAALARWKRDVSVSKDIWSQLQVTPASLPLASALQFCLPYIARHLTSLNWVSDAYLWRGFWLSSC